MNKNSDLTCENINFRLSTTKPPTPMLINLVLINISKNLDWDSLKSCREVCSSWNEAFTPKFYMRSQMKADLSSKELSSELKSQFESLSKIKALSLKINFTYPFMNNLLSSYGTQLTRLTIENSNGLKFQKISNSFGQLLEYCPNIKYLTLVNLKLIECRVHYSPYKNVVPRINLYELTIKSTTLETEFNLTYCINLIPYVFASQLLSVQTINIEYNSTLSTLNVITDNEESHVCKLFRNCVHLTYKNTAKNADPLYLDMGSLEFPNLKRLQCSSTGLTDMNMTGVCVQFPKLKWLNVFTSFGCNDFTLHCPNLMEIELSVNNESSVRSQYSIYKFAHPNVQKLKINLSTRTFEQTLNFFPNLKSLHVDLTGRNLASQLAIFSTHALLKELTIIENSSTEEFENAMENHFSNLLQSLKKLYIQTLNTEEIRSPNLLNIFTLKVANAPAEPTLSSVTLRGFKICSQQYDYVKHQLPFHLLILK